MTFAKTANLRTNPNNPRAIRKDQLNKLVKSLQEFPEMLEARPIVIDKDGTVLGGNMRLKAAQLAGLEEVPVYVREWDEEKDGQFIIKDNVSFGEWDQDMLANEWEPEQLDEWGLNIDWDEPEETEGLTDADDVPEVPEEATTKPGDLWLLGEHRLLCGDSTKSEDVERLMNGATADALVTDPPYGINANKQTLGTGKKTFERGGNWDAQKPDIVPLLTYCKTQVIWGGNYFADVLPPTNDWLCWHKKNDGLSFSEFELAWSNLGKNCRLLSHHWGGENKLHPTMKPVAVMEWCVDMTEGTIFDPFLGSGSTLIAAEKTGRKCYGMEMDPKYCDVIVKRWEEFTGKKAEIWKP